jgi:hypothetical protein
MSRAIASMHSWSEFSRIPLQVPSKTPSPSKWGSFADQICKKSNLIKGRSCNCNFGVKSFLGYYRFYLGKPFILKVTAKVTALLKLPPYRLWGRREVNAWLTNPLSR